MNWLESLLYGAVSGVTEILPISSFAHQQILLKMFGKSGISPVQSLLIHIALLLSVITGCRTSLEQIRRTNHAQRVDRRSLRNSSNLLETRFLKNAALSLLFVYFILMRLVAFNVNMLVLAIFSFLNFLVLLLQTRMMRGNKDERTVSFFDSLAIGISGAAAVLPGVSRVGAMLTTGTACGIEKQKLTNWILLLNIPALLLLTLSDVIDMFANGSQTGTGFWSCVFSMAGAYVFGLVGIHLFKSATHRKDFSGFAFYSLGVMMFALFLYLSVV